MRKIFLVAVVLLYCGFLNAREYKYQGEVSAGLGIGGMASVSRIPLHTVHGVRLNENFFVGAGSGIDIFHQSGGYPDNPGFSATIVPVFTNIKGYLPVSGKVSLLAALDLGYGIGSGDFSGEGGLYVYPQVGCSIKIIRRYALDFTAGYHSQFISGYGYSSNFGAIGLKVAFAW